MVTETESEAMARQVFITANSRGVLLRPIDIFKGQLLDIAGGGEAGEQAARRWHGILHVAGGSIEDFMRAYDFVKRCEPQGADHLAKLAVLIEKALRREPHGSRAGRDAAPCLGLDVAL